MYSFGDVTQLTDDLTGAGRTIGVSRDPSNVTALVSPDVHVLLVGLGVCHCLCRTPRVCSHEQMFSITMPRLEVTQLNRSQEHLSKQQLERIEAEAL